ncbi:MAG TPA: SAM-dependent methyltransferase [Spirochaetota bacterium]|nr:SAM-dependent methyltransferase [Spirochaetota bacterium]
MNKIILFCQNGYSHLLKNELESQGFGEFLLVTDSYIIINSSNYEPLKRLTFSHGFIPSYQEFKADSVNSISKTIFDYYGNLIRDKEIDSQWQLLFFQDNSNSGIGRRINSVKKHFLETCSKRTSRLSKLITSNWSVNTFYNFGLFIFFKDHETFYISDKCYTGFQKRMADDPLAPSRSYLKIEEAYYSLGYEPQQNDTVVDLGAAPGGWSYSAAKRGARILAIDNGNLKGGAKDHPLITHKKEDAFKFNLKKGERVDWLFCDMVEEPKYVLNTIEKWLLNKWCKYFIVNLKFGWVDPVVLSNKLKSSDSIFSKYAKDFKIVHLFHDHEEITIVGEI